MRLVRRVATWVCVVVAATVGACSRHDSLPDDSDTDELALEAALSSSSAPSSSALSSSAALSSPPPSSSVSSSSALSSSAPSIASAPGDAGPGTGGEAELAYTVVDPTLPDAACRAATAARVQMTWYYTRPEAFRDLSGLLMDNLGIVLAELPLEVFGSIQPYVEAWEIAVRTGSVDPLFGDKYIAPRRAFDLWYSIACA